MYISGGTVEFQFCEIHGNTARSRGGGVYISGGKTTLSTTLIHGNAASEGGGANLNLRAGLLYYRLPAPPGYWLPNAFCQVYREACPDTNELIEMLRRFVLVGIMVLVEGMMQIILGSLLAAIFLLFQVEASPYKDMSDNFLASSASFALVAIFICSYAFRNYEFVGLGDIQAKMSLEQRETYVVNQTILSVVVFAIIILALLLAFCIFLVQFAVEGARLRSELRAARGRRLRYKTTQEVVQVPELPTAISTKKHFHIFLSHVRNRRRAAAYPHSRRLCP